MNKQNKKIAICITCFNSQDYIIECINSFKKQNLPDSWEMVFYIGVDFCEKTSKVLESSKISYYWSKKNVGTYILTNSLLQKAKNDGCDIFLRFDSDDIADDNYLINGINNVIQKGFSFSYQIKFSDNSEERVIQYPKNKNAHGQIFFSRYILDNLGGYHEYRVGCDTYFIRRIGLLLNEDVNKMNNSFIESGCKPTFLRRVVQDSLSNSKQTGLGTKFRNDIDRKLRECLRSGRIKIENPATVDLECRRF